MKLKFLDSASSIEFGSFVKGREYLVDDRFGDEMIRCHIAIEVDDVEEDPAASMPDATKPADDFHQHMLKNAARKKRNKEIFTEPK